MLLTLRDADLQQTLALVPDQKVDEGLVRWLREGIRDGRASEGSFLYSGVTRPGEPPELNSMQLLLEVEDVELAFQSDWPALTGLAAVVAVSQESAKIHADTGRLLDLEFDRLDASWRKQDENNVVNIQSHVRGSAADGIRLLTDTPIREALFDLIDDFVADGAIEADVGLEIPLGGDQQPRVDLSLRATEVQLGIPSLDLQFSQIGGQFSYRTESGINSQGASASLFGRPVDIVVSSGQESPAADSGDALPDTSRYSTRMVLRGRVGVDSLYAWQPLPILSRFYGETDYEAVLAVPGSETSTLTITSDLQGVTFAAPAPFGKVASEAAPFSYKIELADLQVHRLGYADLLQTALVLEDGNYDRGEVRLGAEPANFEDVPGIAVRGTLDELRILDWWDFFDQLDGAASGSADARAAAAPATEEPSAPAPDSIVARLKEIEITVKKFNFGEQRIENLILQMERIKQDWWAQLENETLKGRLRFFEDASKPAIVELEYLRLPEGEADSQDEDAFIDIVPQDLPAFNFSCDDIQLGTDNFGKWIFHYRPTPTGARVEQLVAEVKGLQLDGALVWNYVGGQHSSAFEGVAFSKNLDEMSTAWGYPNSIKGKHLDMRADLSWPGSPVWVAPERVSGALTLSAKDGRFADLESMPEVLKLFAIFNASSVVRRLRLDFSDITKSGYSFDTINADLIFSEGEVTTQKSLIINGPSAKFKLDGTTDLINEQFDQKLVVVLPLSENIPLAATVLGAPQVGIPLWLLNKAFGNMFDDFQSVEYRVTGPIADPLIETTTGYKKRMKTIDAAAQPAGEPVAPATTGAR